MLLFRAYHTFSSNTRHHHLVQTREIEHRYGYLLGALSYANHPDLIGPANMLIAAKPGLGWIKVIHFHIIKPVAAGGELLYKSARGFGSSIPQTTFYLRRVDCFEIVASHG